MDKSANTVAFSLSRFGKIRDILSLIGDIRAITEPISSAEGLRQSIELLIHLASLVGIDSRWTDRLRSILDNDAVFDIVLAIVRYVSGIASHETDNDGVRVMLADDGHEVVVDAQSFVDWLPIVIQIISLLRQIRGNQ